MSPVATPVATAESLAGGPRALPEDRSKHLGPANLPELGKAYRWPKGFSPNPGGRPTRKHMAKAWDRLLPCTIEAYDGMPEYLRSFAGMTWAEMFVFAMALEVAKGNVAAYKEIVERREGKVAQPLTGAGGLPLVPTGTTTNIQNILILVARNKAILEAQAATVDEAQLPPLPIDEDAE